jgi:hypothetical protein
VEGSAQVNEDRAVRSTENLEYERGHRTLKTVRKGGKHVNISLAPRTSRAIDLYLGERVSAFGPTFEQLWSATPHHSWVGNACPDRRRENLENVQESSPRFSGRDRRCLLLHVRRQRGRGIDAKTRPDQVLLLELRI